MDDAELLSRARAGDLEAFGDLVDRHRSAVFRAALAALQSPDEADDVAQEAFVIAFQRLAQFRGESTFRTWTISIAWRKALDRRRGARHWIRRAAGLTGRANHVSRARAERASPARGREVSSSDGLEALAGPGVSPEASVLAKEVVSEVKRTVARLPPTLRDPLLLSATGDYNYEQIAEVLHIPVGTVKWRVFEARRRLKQRLARRGILHA